MAVAVFEAALSPDVARRVLTAEIRAAEKGKMETGPKALRALDGVKKHKGDNFLR